MATKRYWRIHSERVGNGPLHPDEAGAIEERDEMVDNDPDDNVTVGFVDMSEEDYEALPEFEGY